MKGSSRKWKISLLSMIVILSVSACSENEDFEDAVPNPGIGTVQASQVIAASQEIQNYYASQYSFDFNENGLLSSIRNLTTGEIEATFEYGTNARSTETSANKLSSGQVLMTIRQTDTYVFHLLFSIGGNGFANSCVETDYENERTAWRFSYDADGHLVRMNDGGDIATFKYDDKGRMISLYDHDCWICEATFSYSDALCTAYPNNDEEWIKVWGYDPNCDDIPEIVISHMTDVPNSLGLFTVVGEFTGYDPEFKYAYLAGLVGKPSTALPAKVHYNYFGEISNVDYRYLYLMTKDKTVRDFKRYEIYEE